MNIDVDALEYWGPPHPVAGSVVRITINQSHKDEHCCRNSESAALVNIHSNYLRLKAKIAVSGPDMKSERSDQV